MGYTNKKGCTKHAFTEPEMMKGCWDAPKNNASRLFVSASLISDVSRWYGGSLREPAYERETSDIRLCKCGIRPSYSIGAKFTWFSIIDRGVFLFVKFVKEALTLRAERLKLIEADRADPPPVRPIKQLTSNT